jgi:hypothetical protein
MSTAAAARTGPQVAGFDPFDVGLVILVTEDGHAADKVGNGTDLLEAESPAEFAVRVSADLGKEGLFLLPASLPSGSHESPVHPLGV